MDRFEEFAEEPRQQPSEFDRARMRRVLGGLPKGPAPVSAEASPEAVVRELRAMRSEVSRLRDLLMGRAQRGAAAADDEVLTRSQAAKLLRVCSESVTKLVRDEGLPCKRVGKEYRFLRSEVVAWLAARGASEMGDS